DGGRDLAPASGEEEVLDGEGRGLHAGARRRGQRGGESSVVERGGLPTTGRVDQHVLHAVVSAQPVLEAAVRQPGGRASHVRDQRRDVGREEALGACVVLGGELTPLLAGERRGGEQQVEEGGPHDDPTCGRAAGAVAHTLLLRVTENVGSMTAGQDSAFGPGGKAGTRCPAARRARSRAVAGGPRPLSPGRSWGPASHAAAAATCPPGPHPGSRNGGRRPSRMKRRNRPAATIPMTSRNPVARPWGSRSAASHAWPPTCARQVR